MILCGEISISLINVSKIFQCPLEMARCRPFSPYSLELWGSNPVDFRFLIFSRSPLEQAWRNSSIFLCRYLHSVELRQQINAGLNVVENWNSANDFVFYGKSGEITSNIRLRAILKNDSKKNKENKWDCKPQLSLEMKY